MVRRAAQSCILALAAAVVSANAPALGQCSIFRQNVPDFDQSRAGLPGDGNTYCVPTSASNWLAYISNNGLPSVFGGPFDWQAAARYDYVTGQIAFVGMEMKTNTSGGTTGKNGKNGLEDVLDARASGKFTVSTYHGYVRLPDLYNFMTENRLILLCYGYYKLNSDSRYYRDGGHCTSLTGMLDVCTNGVSPRLRLRDPADDGTLTSQSTFSSRVTRASLKQFNTTDGMITRWELIDLSGTSATKRVLDVHITIRPRYAVYPAPLNGSWIRYEIVNSVRAQGGSLSAFQTPLSRPIDQGTLSPVADEFFYTTYQPGSPESFPSLYRQNTSTGQVASLGILDRYTPLATDRFGDLYMLRAGAVRRYDASGPGLVEMGFFAIPPSTLYEQLVWDDGRDLLFCVGPSGIQLLDRAMAGRGSYVWPAAATRSGAVRFDITPSGTFVLGSTGSPTFHHLRFNPLIARLDLIQSVTIPGITGIRSIQMTEQGLGRLVAMTNQGPREYTRNQTTGAFEPAAETLFAAVPVGNTLILSKGRSNFQDGVHDTPGYNDMYLAEPGPTIPDCAADIDLDGDADFNDIFGFLNLWFTQVRLADFNESGQIDINDVFSFLNAWFAGC